MTKASPEVVETRSLAISMARTATIAVRRYDDHAVRMGPKTYLELNGEDYDKLTHAIHMAEKRKDGCGAAEEVFSKKFGPIIRRSIKEAGHPESKKVLRRLCADYRKGFSVCVHIRTDEPPIPQGLRPPLTVLGIPLFLKRDEFDPPAKRHIGLSSRSS